MQRRAILSNAGTALLTANSHDMTGRRFPPPWRADRIPGGYVVRDDNGQAIAYLYARANEAEALQAKVLTADEARRHHGCPSCLGRGERG